MKECPVCSAVTFDDMDVCYGCLHRFDEADAAVAPVPAAKKESVLAAQSATGSLVGGGSSGCEPPPNRPQAQSAADRPVRAYRVEIRLVPIDQVR